MSLKNNEVTYTKSDFDKLKNALRKEPDIESLQRSIILAEKNLFVILVVASPIQAKAFFTILAEKITEIKEPSLPLKLFAFQRTDDKPAVFRELISQILDPLYYWDLDNSDKQKKLFVIDASGALKQDKEGWIIFFKRMNEVRNTIMNNLPGPLLLILTQDLSSEFTNCAPDFWSIRSAFVKAESDIVELEPLQRYKNNLKEACNRLHIWRMDKPATLEEIYTPLNILTKSLAVRKDGTEEPIEEFNTEEEDGEEGEEESDGLTAVKNNRKLFISGKPEAGKTTFLKHVIVNIVDGYLNLVPIFIPLKQFSDSKTNLLDFIESEFKRFDFPNPLNFIKEILDEGKAILLLDGLDEVHKQNGLRRSIVDELKKFVNTYPQCKWIVTCRVADIEYGFDDFQYVEISDFDKDQIKVFVYKWFTGERDIADKFFKELEDSRNNQLFDLAKNPLLLTLLCIGFSEALSFPSLRSEIYGDALDALLKKWDTFRRIERDKIYKQLSLGRKRQMFARIAFKTFKDGKYLIPLEALAREVETYLKPLLSDEEKKNFDSISVVKAVELQHGIWIERSKGLYSFAHLTFQEYYAAKYLVSHKEEWEDIVKNHIFDKAWKEIFLLTSEMLDEADKFLMVLCDHLMNFAKDNEKITKLLVDAELKTKKVKVKPLERRIIGVSWIVYIARNLDGALSHSLILALVLATDFDLDIALDFDFAIDLNLARTLARAIAPRRKRRRIRDRALASTRVRALANALASTNEKVIYINDAIKISQEMRLKGLTNDLKNLSKNISSEQLSELRNIIYRHNLHKNYEFGDEAKNIELYLSGTKFLLDCMNKAYISNKEAIENRMLRVDS